jgi:CheY-like chemotaxis protein
MDGTLTVESEAGRGSTVTIELPAGTAAGVAPEETPVPVAQSGELLYVDDAEENLRLVADLLASSRPGLDVRTARRGDEATELAKEHCPSVLLLDLNLPDMPGEEVLRRLRARPETVNVPVVVLSADSTSRNITRLLESGAEAYLTKPLNVPQFLHVVDRLLAETR